MKILVNGDRVDVAADATVADIVRLVRADRPPSGIAVAVNGEVVPRAAWTGRVLASDDRVEVLSAIGGG